MSASRQMERTSRVIVVDGEFARRPQQYEVVRERWLNNKTGRWRTIWCARHKGDWAWHAGRTIRKALLGAACVREGERPAWVAATVRAVEKVIS